MKTKNFDIRSEARISNFFDENKTFQYSHYCQFRLICEKVECQSRLPNAINQCFTNWTSTTSIVSHQQKKCVDIVCFT